MKLRNIFCRPACLMVVAALAGSSAVRAESASLAPDESRIIRVAASATGAPQHISLGLNKAVVVELDRDARDVFIANPQIADAVVRTPRRIFLMSLKIGQTNAIFLDAQGRQIGTLEIAVGSDVSDLNNQIARELPDAKVSAQGLNDTVVLSGSVNNVQEASKAQDMAKEFQTGRRSSPARDCLRIRPVLLPVHRARRPAATSA